MFVEESCTKSTKDKVERETEKKDCTFVCNYIGTNVGTKCTLCTLITAIIISVLVNSNWNEVFEIKLCVIRYLLDMHDKFTEMTM